MDYDNCRANPGKPCLYDVVERHDGVTVEVLRCRRCGRRSIQWMRPEIAALQDAMTGEEPPAKTAAGEPEPRDYWPAVESWLKEAAKYPITAAAMVALTADENVHDVAVVYNAGPFETATMASVLQLMAGHKYDLMREDDDEDPEDDGEEEEDDDEI